MRKKTEELWKEAGGNSLTDYGVEWLETFRRLAIENARECAEAVGVTASLPGTNNGYTFVAFNGSDVPVGTKLFTFPSAAQVPEGWQLVPIEPTVEIVQAAQDYFASHDEWGFSGVYRAMLAAAPEVKQ